MEGIFLFCKLFFMVIGFCTVVSIPIALIMAVVFLIRDKKKGLDFSALAPKGTENKIVFVNIIGQL